MTALIRPLENVKPSPASLLVILGMLLIGWQASTGMIPLLGQWIVFTGLLVGAGIPHGALDHLVSRETAIRTGQPFSWGRFLTKYLASMIVYGLVWFVFPSLSLVVFLVVSAWHFGETDIERVPSVLSWTITRFAMGSFVIMFILLTHPAEVTPILERITNYNVPVLSVWQRALPHSSSVWQYWALATGGLFGLSLQFRPVSIDWFRLSQLVIILAIGYWLPLLLAFGLYFGGWHALSSFQTICGYLDRDTQHASTGRQIWLKSLPFTALALISLAVFAWWWQLSARHWDPLPLLFVFLSVITLPHLHVLHGMNSQLDDQLEKV